MTLNQMLLLVLDLLQKIIALIETLEAEEKKTDTWGQYLNQTVTRIQSIKTWSDTISNHPLHAGTPLLNTYPGFMTGAGTTGVHIDVTGNIITFSVPGVGTTTLTLF